MHGHSSQAKLYVTGILPGYCINSIFSYHRSRRFNGMEVIIAQTPGQPYPLPRLSKADQSSFD